MPTFARNTSRRLAARFLWSPIMAAALIIAVAACAGSEKNDSDSLLSTVPTPTTSPSPDPESANPAGAPMSTDSPDPGVEQEARRAIPGVTPTSVPFSEPEVKTGTPDSGEEPAIEKVIHCTPPEGFRNVSVAERILEADMVAKVRLLSASGEVDTVKYFGPGARVNTGPAPVLEFEFRVLEYLKGQGPDKVVAVASGYRYESESQVRALLPFIVARRDTQWDDHDAIVFLRESDDHVPSTLQPERYYFSQMLSCGYDNYTINSILTKRWLPAAGVHGDQNTGDQQQFLMDAPTREPGSLGYTPPPTITLEELKTRIAELNAEVATGDGSEEYRECLQTNYLGERLARKRLEEDGTATVSVERDLLSGLPAGKVLDTRHLRIGYLPDKTGKYWLEGAHHDLFGLNANRLAPYDWSGDGVRERLSYVVHLTTLRPLPAGEYRFYEIALNADRVICEAISDLEKIENETVVNVTAPPGVLHEAFFDPASIDFAVGADGATGILKPSGFTVDGVETKIESVRWEAGVVTMKLKTPAHLSGHHAEFIGLDGSVVLNLQFDNVQTENSTFKWAVTGRPWEDGDLLMLRIKAVP